MTKEKKGPVKNVIESVRNGLADALGLGWGPNNYQGSQVTQVDTTIYDMRYYFITNMRNVISQMYSEIGLAQTVVDIPVDDAMRGGISIKSKQLDEDQIQELITTCDRENIWQVVAQAGKWNRLFGGAGIIIYVRDQDPEKQLDIDTIGKDTLIEFWPVDLWELTSPMYQDDYDPLFQSQQYEYYYYRSKKIHKSRILMLKGIEAPSIVRPRLRGWGLSVIEVLVRSLNQYLKGTAVTFEVLDEFKVDVYKIKGLADTLALAGGTETIRERIRLANAYKNFQNAVVLGSEDDWDHKQLNFSGIDTAFDGIRRQVASDMRMPMIKLFGEGPSGLNQSSEDQIEVYNSMVESQVRHKLKYHIIKVLQIKCQQLFQFIPDDLMIQWAPLRVLSAEQEENVKTQKFTRLFQAKSMDLISKYEFREACNKGDLFDITVDLSGDQLNPDDPDIETILEAQPEPAVEPAAPNGGDKE